MLYEKKRHWPKVRLMIVIVIVILIAVLYRVMVPYVNYNTGIDGSSLEGENVVLNYPVFDGKQLWENAAVVIENGVITSVALVNKNWTHGHEKFDTKVECLKTPSLTEP